MTPHFTTHEKLVEVEQMLRVARPTRGEPGTPERRQYEVLRTLADDLRGRLDGAPNVAMTRLEQAIIGMRRAQTPGQPYPLGPLIRVAEELIARWPTVKMALEKFGAHVEEERV